MTILSRHRLVQPYRSLLCGLWLLPIAIWSVVFLVQLRGNLVGLLQPQLWLLLALMALPALYIWRQGVDVCTTGLQLRIYLPQYVTYQQIADWQLREYPAGKVLQVQAKDGRNVLSFHAAHLSQLPTLLHALNTHVALRDYVRH